jgi:hypothetical protein
MSRERLSSLAAAVEEAASKPCYLCAATNSAVGVCGFCLPNGKPCLAAYPVCSDCLADVNDQAHGPRLRAEIQERIRTDVISRQG